MASRKSISTGKMAQLATGAFIISLITIALNFSWVGQSSDLEAGKKLAREAARGCVPGRALRVTGYEYTACPGRARLGTKPACKPT